MMMSGTNIEQRSVVLFPFPQSDLSSSKKRPALVVSHDDFNKTSPDVICCLITSNPKEYPHIIKITNKDMETGLLAADSVVKPYRLFTVEKSLISDSVGKLNPKKTSEVIKELAKVIKG